MFTSLLCRLVKRPLRQLRTTHGATGPLPRHIPQLEALEDRLVPTTISAVFDPSSAMWYIHDQNASGGPSIPAFRYGAPNWQPVLGDWTGNGKTTIGVVDPTTETWYLKNDNGPGAPSITPFRYGAPGWVPLVGDWNGDGRTTVGVYDPTTATWYLKNDNGPGTPSITPFRYGAPGWLPVVGDWNGDGKTSIGVYNPTTSTFYLRNSNTPGGPDAGVIYFGTPFGSLPLAGDWSGVGRSTIGVFDVGTATWHLHAQDSAHGQLDFRYGAGTWQPVSSSQAVLKGGTLPNPGPGGPTPGVQNPGPGPGGPTPLPAAPVVTITGVPPSNHLAEGSGLALQASVSPSGQDSYSWQALKNGAPFASGNGGQFSFTPDDSGVYTVSVTVTDSLGQTGSASASITADNVVPVAQAGGPYTGAVGNAIAFSGSATDANPADVAAGFTYQWNFGDGSSGSGASVSHAYVATGTYTATLTATDKDGETGTSTATVTVTTVLASLPLVYQNNLQYLGGFRVPNGTYGSASFSFSGADLAYNPVNNSLFLGNSGNIAEVSIPSSFVISSNPTDLPVASVLQPFTPVLSRVPNLEGQDNIGDLMVVGNKLIGSAYVFYDANGTTKTSHFVLDSLNLAKANVTGMFQVGTMGGGYVGGYMTPIPQQWQAALGAPYMTGLSSLNIVTRTSAGPAVFGFDPSKLGPTTTPDIPYVYTPNGVIGTYGDPNPNYLYNGNTTTTGVVFAPGTRSVLFVGSQGLGKFYYGLETDANDPYRGGKGNHSVNGEYAYQIWAYDANDFVAVRNGQKQPQDVRPYAVWNFDFPEFEGAKDLAGATFDPTTGRLYVTQGEADVEGYLYNPIIQVFQLNLNAPPPPAGPQIGFAYATPQTEPHGSNITLAAFNVMEANKPTSISKVVFYLDSDGDGIFNANTDTVLGNGTQNGSTWNYSFSTSGWSAGTYTVFAQATDLSGTLSSAVKLTFTLT